MPIINLTTLQDILAGTQNTDAIFTATMYRAGSRAIRVEDTEVIFPTKITVDITGGTPDSTIELTTPPVNCYWNITVEGPHQMLLRRYVTFPSGAGPFEFEDLVDVDITTALPDAGTSLADAYANLIESYAIRAEEAAAESGLSAYEIAVEEGFSGTEAQWLASLVGPTGPQGIQGEPGPSPTETAYTVLGGTTGTQPTFSGTPLFTGSYSDFGVLIHFQIQVDMDNILTFGTGQYYVTLPFASKHGYMFREGCLHDISEDLEYHISGHVDAGSDVIYLFTTDRAGSRIYDFPFEQGEPITLTTADNLHITGTYIKDDS